MKLAELEPELVRWMRGGIIRKVRSFAKAQGVMFLCPKCYVANGGRRGTHRVVCWSKSRGVPDDATPGPGRWTLLGTGLKDLSLGPEPGKSHSVVLQGACAWHGFVENGAVRDA